MRMNVNRVDLFLAISSLAPNTLFINFQNALELRTTAKGRRALDASGGGSSVGMR